MRSRCGAPAAPGDAVSCQAGALDPRSCRALAQGLVASQRMESSGPGSKPLSAASPALAGGFFTWEALFVFYAEIVYQLRDKVA